MHYKKKIDKRWILIPALLMFLSSAFPGTSSALMSLDDERKLGKEFYEKLEKDHLILRNEQADAFLTRLGKIILEKSNKAPFDFKFSIIRSSAINAFATPGGYIYVNQGLINLVENEAQLAGVLAHEIAHVNGRHIAEMLEKSQKVNLSALAAIIAGAFLGRGGDATAAVTSFSMAAATSLSLKYSREQEEAADRAGLAYLVSAGYEGQAMPDFLKIMRRYEFYSNTVPSYFLTHPETDERNHYLDSLLKTTYKTSGATRIIGNLKRIQTILLLEEESPEKSLRHFRNVLKDKPNDVNALYGFAVSAGKLGMLDESIEYFKKVVLIAPKDPEILRDFGIVLFKIGQFHDAKKNLSRALRMNDNDSNSNLYLGKTLLALGDTTNALPIFRKLEGRGADDPEIYFNLAMAYGNIGLSGDSHYFFGLYFKEKGKKDSAVFHFKKALNHYGSADPKTKEIKKEIESLSH